MTSYKLIGETKDVAVQTGDQINGESVNVEEMKNGCLQISRSCSMLIGFVIGCFIQCSTLGANFLMTTIYGNQVYLTQTFMVVSLVWCFISSIMGVSILLFLRSLVVTAFYATNSSQEDSSTLEAKESFMVQVIENIEQFFAIGSLIGVGAAWMVTDVLLDMESHMYHSLGTILVALIWFKLASPTNKEANAAEEKPKEENKEMAKPLVEREVVVVVV